MESDLHAVAFIIEKSRESSIHQNSVLFYFFIHQNSDAERKQKIAVLALILRDGNFTTARKKQTSKYIRLILQSFPQFMFSDILDHICREE